MLVLIFFFALSPLLEFNSKRLGESVKCCSVIVTEVTLSHVNKRCCPVVMTVSLKSCYFKRKSGKNTVPALHFLMFTAAWTCSSGRNQDCVIQFLLLQCTILYSICEKWQHSLEYCAMSSVLLLWNVTVQLDLCILKIHSFLLLLYIYMCHVCLYRKENKCLFFIFVHACLNAI